MPTKQTQHKTGMGYVWGRRQMQIGLWWENMKKRDHLEDQGIEAVLKQIWKKEWDGVEWTFLAQDRNK